MRARWLPPAVLLLLWGLACDRHDDLEGPSSASAEPAPSQVAQVESSGADASAAGPRKAEPARPAVVERAPEALGYQLFEACEKSFAVVGMFRIRLHPHGEVAEAELQMTKNSPECAQALRRKIMAMRFEPCDNRTVACEFPYAMSTMIHWE